MKITIGTYLINLSNYLIIDHFYHLLKKSFVSWSNLSKVLVLFLLKSYITYYLHFMFGNPQHLRLFHFLMGLGCFGNSLFSADLRNCLDLLVYYCQHLKQQLLNFAVRIYQKLSYFVVEFEFSGEGYCYRLINQKYLLLAIIF